MEKNSYLLGYLIGQQLDLSRDEPWIIKIDDDTIKILKVSKIEMNNPELEVE